MASRSVTRASRIRNPAVAGTGVQPNGQNPPQDEQEVSQNRGENQGEVFVNKCFENKRIHLIGCITVFVEYILKAK